MTATSPFEIARPGLCDTLVLARVESVQDPLGLGRVLIRLLHADGIGEQDGPIWARVAVPFGGDGYGAFLLPGIGEQVAVLFAHGDSRLPVVVGALWHGTAAPPESLPSDRVDRWTLVGKNGTRIAIVEAAQGQEQIALATPNGVAATLTDAGGGRVTIEVATTTITIDPGGVRIETQGRVGVQASQVQVTAGQVSVDTALARFSGVIQCQTLQTTTVISNTYMPGAGNQW